MRCVWLPIHSRRHEAVGEARGASLFLSDHQLKSALSEPTGDERNAERSTATASSSTPQTYIERSVVLVVAAPALSQDGAHSAVESRTCGCNLCLRRTRRAVPLAPSVPPCGLARTPPGSSPTSPRFPKPNSPLEILCLELGYILRVSTASPRVTFCTSRYTRLPVG